MRILFTGIVFSMWAAAQTATIKWKDVATPEVVQLQPCGGQALCLSVRNPGKSDNWGQGYAPQPKFFETVDATVPGYGVLTAELQDIQHSLLTGVTSIARQNQYHYEHKRNGTWSHPAYAHTGQHMLDGGDTLYVRFVPLADPFELGMLAQITQAQKDKAAQILNINEARVAQWPLLQKMMGLYKINMTHFGNANAQAPNRDIGWLIRPENFVARWWGATSHGGLPALRHWYGGVSVRASGEGFSNFHYGHPAWAMAAGLRNNDPVSLAMGLYMLRYKIAYGLVDSDSPGGVWNKIWRNEKGIPVGQAGTAPSSAKSWDLDVVLGHTLLPSDPLIARGFQVRSEFLKNSGFQWSGGGGSRILGRHLSNLHDYYVATGDIAFKQKAEAEIVHAFSMAVNGARLWFREYVDTSVGCGEGGIVLPSVYKWVVNEGALPGYVFPAGHALAGQPLLGHLNNMRDWYLTYCGQWQKSSPTVPNPGDLWRPAYNSTGATPTSLNAVYNSNSQGVFWTGLRPFMTAAQQAQADAIEKRVYTSLPNFTDAADGGLASSSEKWVPMFVQSSRN